MNGDSDINGSVAERANAPGCKPGSIGRGGSNPSRPTLNPRKQGALGIGQAVGYYAAQGYAVFVPIADMSRYDLLIDTGTQILRVEVKTTTRESGEVALRTMGGNRSWNGMVKRISEDDCDIVFAVNLATGAVREFQACELLGRTTVTVR